MAQISLGPCKFVQDMDSHGGFITVPCQEANGDNLERSFLIFYEIIC